MTKTRAALHRWTNHEVRKLEEGAEAGLKTSEIQLRFLSHLTLQQVRDKRRGLGLPPASPGRTKSFAFLVYMTHDMAKYIKTEAKAKNVTRQLLARELIHEALTARGIEL